MMGSSRAETIIDIWFSVSMLVAGTYIVSIHVYGKFLSQLLLFCRNQITKTQHVNLIQCYLYEILSSSGCFSMLVV